MDRAGLSPKSQSERRGKPTADLGSVPFGPSAICWNSGRPWPVQLHLLFVGVGLTDLILCLFYLCGQAAGRIVRLLPLEHPFARRFWLENCMARR
jgi:hypothetical protein